MKKGDLIIGGNEAYRIVEVGDRVKLRLVAGQGLDLRALDVARRPGLVLLVHDQRVRVLFVGHVTTPWPRTIWASQYRLPDRLSIFKSLARNHIT